MTIDPTKDGVDHINIYSKGLTELGQLLSNFAHTPIKLRDGTFQSLEGYWYWLLSDKDGKTEILRKLYGWEAKKVARELKIPDWPTGNITEFRDKFMDAMEQKLLQTPGLRDIMVESTLPFKHYYVYGTKVIEVKGCGWMLDWWEDLRRELGD